MVNTQYLIVWRETYNSQTDGRKKPTYEQDVKQLLVKSYEEAREFVDRHQTIHYSKDPREGEHDFKIYTMTPTLLEETA
jgi:hypothetical protein